MRRRIIRKTFNTIFMSTFICFNIFLYLFATRVTPWDIDYFAKDTKEKSQKLITVINEKRTELAKSIKDNASSKLKDKESPSITAETSTETPSDDKEVTLQSDTFDLIYYAQTDDRWKSEIYGANNTIGVYGCGPTALAMILSTLTDNIVTPVDAAQWAYDNGHFSNNSGSYHSIIPKGAEKHGLKQHSLKKPTKEVIIDELSQGNMIVVLMKKGTFTTEGHFLILRGLTKESQVLIADPKSLENSNVPWDIDLILEEAKYTASYGGPFWSISKAK